MATKKEQGYYTAALGAAVAAAGIALDDPGLTAGGIGIAAAGLSKGTGGTTNAPVNATPREGVVTGNRDPDAPAGRPSPVVKQDNSGLLALGAAALLLG
jgi:hypothetical protein